MSDPANPGHTDYLISTNGWRAEPIPFPEEPLFPRTVRALVKELDSKYNERCGFITNEQEIVSVENTHEDRHNNFYMDEDSAHDAIDYIYKTAKQEVMGIWHTHPNGYSWPSPRDIRGWPKESLGWRYFLVSRGNVTEWRRVRGSAG